MTVWEEFRQVINIRTQVHSGTQNLFNENKQLRLSVCLLCGISNCILTVIDMINKSRNIAEVDSSNMMLGNQVNFVLNKQAG